MTYRPSIEERIAWTSGIRPSDRRVLQALAKFADFTTGTNARPNLARLVAWSELSRATVVRALRRLQDDGWIEGVSQHRHATCWRLCLERFAETPTRAKPVTRDHRSEAQFEPQTDPNLRLTLNDLRLKMSRSEAQNEPPTPSQYPVSVPKCSDADRVGGFPDPETTPHTTTDDEAKVEARDAPQPEANSPDLSTDRGPDSESVADRPGGPRSDQTGAPGGPAPLQQRSDSPGPPRSRLPVPAQLTFGPTDLTHDARLENRQQLITALREGLKRKSG